MKHTQAQQPHFINQSHIDYLNDLRDSGITNMFNAWRYLKAEFDVNEQTAIQIFTHWMRDCR